MSTVLHVGITAPTYSSEAITKSFVDVFGECVYFDWQAHRFNYGIEKMRENIFKASYEANPDIIFLHLNHNNEVLSIDNVKELSKIGFTIWYTEDVRDDISWFEKITPLIGVAIFTNINDVETLKSKGINNAQYLPVSYNNVWYKKTYNSGKYYGDIVFLGNNYVNTNMDFPQAKQRQEMIAVLKKEFGDKFQAYGGGQENSMLNPQEAVECYNNAKIAIGHNNFNRKGYQSDRCLNSIGCGCFTLMQKYDGIENDFPFYLPDAEYPVSKTQTGFHSWVYIHELISLCNRSDEDIKNISEYQYKEVTEKHTWYNRAKSIEKIING